MSKTPSTARTLDVLFEGALRIYQPAGGYRFSIDSILLAHQVRPKAGEVVLDLGTGCGIVPLLLCYRHRRITVWAVEIQALLADLARRNVESNRLQDRIFVLNADLRELGGQHLPELYDLIVTNPPYRRQNSGRLNPNRQRALARHEVTVKLRDILAVVRRRLRAGGCFTAIYTAERTLDILAGMQAAGIEPKRLRMVHTKPGASAKRVIVEGIKGAQGGMKVAPPLIVHEADGSFSDEVAAMLRP